MFRALLAHLQEALHKRHLVYCVRVTLVGFNILIGVDLQTRNNKVRFVKRKGANIENKVCYMTLFTKSQPNEYISKDKNYVYKITKYSSST
jgi:hypothetical protein